MTDLHSFLAPLIEVHERLLKEEGPFTLFALLEPGEGSGGYDLLVAASWLDGSSSSNAPLFEALQSTLSNEQLLALAHVIVNPDPAFVRILGTASNAAASGIAWTERARTTTPDANQSWLEVSGPTVKGISFRRALVLSYQTAQTSALSSAAC